MTLNDWIGTAGVFLLLVAFFLNVFGFLSRSAHTYQGMNALGAGIAAYASWRIGYMPFVVLEGFWSIVSIAALAGVHQADSGS